MHKAIAALFFLPALGGCMTAWNGYTSGQDMTVACAQSPIQSGYPGIFAPHPDDCRRITLNDITLVATNHYRHFEHPQGFANISYGKAGHGTVARYRPVRDMLTSEFEHPGETGSGFSENEWLDVAGRTYEIVSFKLADRDDCYGFAHFGAAVQDGHRDRLFGYACSKGPGMSRDRLAEFLASLVIGPVQFGA